MEIKNKYTRKVDREFMDILLSGYELDSEGNTKISPKQANKAWDYLVGALYDLTQEQVDELTTQEFATMKEAVQALRDDNASKAKN